MRDRRVIEERLRHATYDSDRRAAGFVIKISFALPGTARQLARSLEISRSSGVDDDGPLLAHHSLAVFSNPI